MFSIIVWTLTIVVALAVIMYSFVGPKILHMEPFIVLSGSMEPSIPVGAVAVVDTKATNPQVGDIVTFEIKNDEEVGTGNGSSQKAKRGTLVTHRVSRIQDGYYVMKGDANENEDFNVVYPEQIIGTYRMHVPKLGFLLKRIDTRLRLMLAGLLIMLNLTSTSFSIAVQGSGEDEKGKKKKKKKKKIVYVYEDDDDEEVIIEKHIKKKTSNKVEEASEDDVEEKGPSKENEEAETEDASEEKDGE